MPAAHVSELALGLELISLTCAMAGLKLTQHSISEKHTKNLSLSRG